jgi:UDP-glucose 4-epimerase
MNTANKSVLVTGGAGYIGSHTVLELCGHGHDVTVFDSLRTGHEINIDPRAEFIGGDILNTDELKAVFSKSYDAVFHFAALKAAGESMLEPQKYSTANITGTINILNQMIEHDVKNIVFSSTAAVYGIPEYLPIDEDHSLEPINFYGFTKIEIERLLHWYSKLKGIKYAALRYFNAAGYDTEGRITGLERDPQNLLPIVMETAIGTRKSMQVYGDNYNTRDGSGIRDYIHVADLATAHLKAMEYMINQKENLILNLATGVGYSVLDVIKSARQVTGEEISHKVTERRTGDPAKLVAVSKLAKDKIGFECKYSDLDTILKSMWNVYNKKSVY